MSSLVVDTSALVSILNEEEDNEEFAIACYSAPLALVSTATLHEANCVMVRGRIFDGTYRLEALVSKLELEIVAFDVENLHAATFAYARYGRGTKHRAGLNMGDCFSYALAKTRNLPLLFKGNDFNHTDIEPALKPA